jgi:aerobic carbon-monoxide dehydrogenase small subunit
MKVIIALSVNGDPYELAVAGHERLIDVIRDGIGLTGTKEGCGEGECGACTVIMNGEPVNSCLVLAAQADGAEIITIEGLLENGDMCLLQRKFVDMGAVQCGFCSPGMIMTAKALLDADPDPSEPEIRDALSGNLCRCTGYEKIVDAVLATAAAMAGGVPTSAPGRAEA